MILCHIYQLNILLLSSNSRGSLYPHLRITIPGFPHWKYHRFEAWISALYHHITSSNTTIFCIISQGKKTHTPSQFPHEIYLLALIDNPTGLKKWSELSGIEIWDHQFMISYLEHIMVTWKKISSKVQDGAPKIAKLLYKWLNAMVYGR